MKFEELAEIVANDFFETMKEFDFQTFDEMKKCYWWTSQDIKEEVDGIIRQAKGCDAYIDELDGSLVFLDGQDMAYRKFAKMWRNALAKKAA